jgi:hypothetical protein
MSVCDSSYARLLLAPVALTIAATLGQGKPQCKQSVRATSSKAAWTSGVMA